MRRERHSRVACEKGGVNEMIETRWSERTRDTALLQGDEVIEEEKTMYTLEKGYISLECKREERAETRREEGVRSTSERRG